MDVQTETTLPRETNASAPAALLECLAARFRPSGLFLVALHSDGSVAYFDSGADAFFLKYVLPIVQRPQIDPGAGGFRDWLAASHPAISVHRHHCGLVCAGINHIEKRHKSGLLLLIGRHAEFSLSEDAHRICGNLQLDSHWLQKQAAGLCAYDEASIQRQAKLFLANLRDQFRLGSLEGELSSVSEQLASTYEELSLIYQVSGGMKVNRGPADFFMQTCIEVQQVMCVAGIGVALRPDTHASSEPILYGQLNIGTDRLLRLCDELNRVVGVRKGALLINDLSADQNFNWLADNARQMLAVPLQRHDQVLGCLYALDKETGDFDSADSKLLNSIANESAIYLENSRLFEDMRGLMMGLLHSLTSAVDAKDPYTYGHSERVALLSRHLSQQVGLNEHDIEQVYMAGLLHDVGKIGVPESVLQKTGKLTAEEFDAMKKHPEIGARILQDVRQIKQVIPGVLHHHERYDGAGYPMGLAGEDIPLMGRIICLADSFDAMTSNRTYRRALPLEVALAEIRRCSGTHFDPRLAEAFLLTGADGYREMLRDHQQKSKKLLDVQQTLRPGPDSSVTAGSASSI